MTVRRFVLLGICVALVGGVSACDSGSLPQAAIASPPASSAPVATGQPPPPVGAALPPPTEPPLIARVNGQPILLADYENQVAQFEAAWIAQGLDPNSADGQAQLAQVREQVLSGMIDQVLIEQEAGLKGIAVSDEAVAAEIEEMIAISGGAEAFAAQLSANGETETEIRTRVRAAMLASVMRDQVIANLASAAPQVHARHILVDSADLASSLLAQLQAGADFTSLAQQYSQDTLTRDGGGDLGWFPHGVLISKEVEDAAFALQPGQYSSVAQSAFGFHIVQVIEVDPARPLSADQLLTLQQAAFENWLASLRAAANIER